jgi:hypothetical protein
LKVYHGTTPSLDSARGAGGAARKAPVTNAAFLELIMEHLRLSIWFFMVILVNFQTDEHVTAS